MRGCEALVESLRRSTVQVANGGAGGGSGVVWDQAGTIVTNAHVLRGDAVRVVSADGRRLRARVSKRDRDRDLAVLETGVRDLQPADIGDSSALRAGQVAVAIGNPMGVAGAVAAGLIHSVGPLGFGARRNWVQADVRLAPGYSGGILADAEGRVIGINTMIFHGLGLAIPSNEVREFVSGFSSLVRLGVEMVPIREGLMVIGIEHGSLAERSGVRIGDALRCSQEKLRELLASVKAEGSADIPVLRGGEMKTLRVHTVEAGARAA